MRPRRPKYYSGILPRIILGGSTFGFKSSVLRCPLHASDTKKITGVARRFQLEGQASTWGAAVGTLPSKEIRTCSATDMTFDLIREFNAIGYHSYRLLPGLDALVQYERNAWRGEPARARCRIPVAKCACAPSSCRAICACLGSVQENRAACRYPSSAVLLCEEPRHHSANGGAFWRAPSHFPTIESVVRAGNGAPAAGESGAWQTISASAPWPSMR